MTNIAPSSGIELVWTIDKLDYKIADGFVFNAHYRVMAISDQLSSSLEPFYSSTYGALSFERPDNLIPYEDLTEEIVVGWVKDKLGGEKVAGIEAGLAANIESQIYPSSASGVPWNG